MEIAKSPVDTTQALLSSCKMRQHFVVAGRLLVEQMLFVPRPLLQQ